MKTQVAIIGAGPAGALLSHILSLNSIDNVVLERQSRAYVLGRIRAGVLEQTTVDLLREVGLSARMDAEGHPHDRTGLVWAGQHEFFLDIKEHTGKQFMAYGQTRLQEDLYAAGDKRNQAIVFEAGDVMPHDVTTDTPYVTYEADGVGRRLDCDIIAGCDGYHGISRQQIPDLAIFEKTYPFGWLGILSETPPLDDLIYANHPRGFALASMRNPMLSRYYVQAPITDTIEAWPDDRFWEELKARYPQHIADRIVTGASIEKSLAPIRSLVAEPMRHGNLYLAGDAAHIVPPTGAKGLNLAVSDTYYLSNAIAAKYKKNDDTLLEGYSDTALRRVWSAVRFSWWLTTLMHRFPQQSAFEQRTQEAELHHVATSKFAQAAFAEQYAGLDF